MAEEKKDEAVEIKNIVTVADSGPCKKKITVEVPEEKIKEALADQFNELKRDAVLPGFRKGRAPMRLLEKRFGGDVSMQVKLKLLADASDAAIKDNEIDVLGDPDIDHDKIELPETGALKFDFEAEVRPDFDLPEIEGIEVNKPAIEVTDEKVEEELDGLRRRMGIFEPRDGKAIEDGDQIIADALIKTEGVDEIDKKDNIEIAVRENGFVGGVPVENLPEVLKGAKSGDNKKTTVDIPATFYNEELRGKKVEIEIHVKDVKELVPAELDEDFLKKFSMDDAEELRDKIRETHEQQADQQARQKMADQIYEYLIGKAEFDLPQSIVADQSQRIMQRQYSNLMMKGLKPDQIEEEMKKLQANSETQAVEQMKLFFIMDKIAEKLDIQVSPEEINGHIAQVAAQRGKRPEKMREELARDGSLAQFSLQIREQKCVEKMLESAKITDVAGDKPAAKKTAAKKKTTKKKAAPKKDDAEKKPAAKKKTTKKKAAKKKE